MLYLHIHPTKLAYPSCDVKSEIRQTAAAGSQTRSSRDMYLAARRPLHFLNRFLWSPFCFIVIWEIYSGKLLIKNKCFLPCFVFRQRFESSVAAVSLLHNVICFGIQCKSFFDSEKACYLKTFSSWKFSQNEKNSVFLSIINET